MAITARDHGPIGPARRVLLVAAAALINSAGRVLLTQRPPGKSLAGLWEFPGGKLEPGESPEQALARELAEELGIVAAPQAFAPLAFASHSYPEFHLLMPLFLLRDWHGTPSPREGQVLAWAEGQNLGTYCMPPADLPLIAPLQRALRDQASSSISQ